MNDSGNYRNALREAVLTLVGDGTIRERLETAFQFLVALQSADAPIDHRAKFDAVTAALRERLVTFNERPHEINLRGPKSGAIAEQIFELYDALDSKG